MSLTAQTSTAQTTVIPRPRRGLLAGPLLAGAGFVALGAAQLLLPAQNRPFTRTSDYVIEWSFAVGLWASVLAVLALHSAHRGRAGWGRVGLIGTAVFAIGNALVGTAVVATALSGDNALPQLFLPGLLGCLVGGVLLGIDGFRAGLLPRALAVALALSLPVTMALGHAGPLVGGAVWVAVGAALTARGRRA